MVILVIFFQLGQVFQHVVIGDFFIPKSGIFAGAELPEWGVTDFLFLFCQHF